MRDARSAEKTSIPKSDGDVTVVLREKIREQAQQLTDLQKRCSMYEAQCAETPSQRESQLTAKVRELERKLADLTRPIPLSDSLSFPPPSVSLSLSQLMELYSLLYVRMNELLKEREELQANLHEEILFSEEQSVILETMREEIAGTRSHTRSESVQTDAGDEQLKAKTEALAEAYSEIARLEEEKNALLEYVEQQAQREEAVQAEISRLQAAMRQEQPEVESLRALLAKTSQEAAAASQELKEAGERHAELVSTGEAALSKTTAALEATEKELQTLRTKHAETQQLLQELQEFRRSEEEAHIEALHEAQSTRLEEDNKSLRQMLTQLQSELESMHASKPAQAKVDESTITESEIDAKEAIRQCQSQIATLNASFSALLSVLDRPSA